VVLIPLPDRDFDLTEVSVPWKHLKSAGCKVVFATEKGAAGPVPKCDPLLIRGVVCGQLGAEREPLKFYSEMLEDESYNHPLAWSDIDVKGYDGLILPGGHAKGMRQYLASPMLHQKVAEFWELNRPVGAICHGPLVLARAKNPQTQKSLLYERKSMALPKYMERLAFFSTCLCRGRYYRTDAMYVEDEMKSCLKSPTQFSAGSKPFFGLGVPGKGTATNNKPATVLVDGNYISARWPGDAYLFAKTFHDMLFEHANKSGSN